MLLGSYEKETVDLFGAIVRPGMTAVDIGAHVGFFTKHLSKLTGPTGKVIAFEAHPETYQILVRNCRKLVNVSTVNAAVTDTDGEVTLYDSGGSTGSNSLIASRSDYAGSNTVRAVRLDDFLAGSNVDVVKIDVEGAELEVLQGMRETLARSSDVSIVIEFFPPVWADHAEGPRVLLDRLESLGLELFVIGTGGTRTPVSEWDSFDAFRDSIVKYVNILATKVSASSSG
jgi:FkbM family methyltransferase